MEESSESGHIGGCWRALPAHKGRKEDREEEVVSQEERGEKGGRGEKDSTVQDGSGNPDCSQASITHGGCLAAVSLCRATCQTHPLPSSLSL